MTFNLIFQILMILIYQKMEVTLNRTSKSYPFWYLINGPLTDAVHHICQMVTWRRISGNPTPRISPFTGKSY